MTTSVSLAFDEKESPSSPVIIGREYFSPSLLTELRPLIFANHKASESQAPLDPQWDGFLALQDAGALCLIVARVNYVPVGYVAHAALINQSSGEIEAKCLAVYVEPQHRTLALRLVSASEEAAMAAGAKTIVYSVPHLSRAGAFFEAVGYRCAELVMEKRL